MGRALLAIQPPPLTLAPNPPKGAHPPQGLASRKELNIGGLVSPQGKAAVKVTRWPKGRAIWVERFSLNRHPGEGRDLMQQALRLRLWTPAFAGVTDWARSFLPTIVRHPCSPSTW